MGRLKDSIEGLEAPVAGEVLKALLGIGDTFIRARETVGLLEGLG